MASQQDIKRRIRSIGSTHKITRAMELVAAAKLRRSQQRIVAMRPYANRMLELITSTARALGTVRGLPLLESRETRTVALLPLTGDRGLAGAFNAQVLRRSFALEHDLQAQGIEVKWLVGGKRGRSSLRFRRREIVSDWTGFSDRPEFADAQAVAHRLGDLYAGAEVDAVLLVYNRFVTPVTQTVVEQEVLPLPRQVLEGFDEGNMPPPVRGEVLYEPDPEAILVRLIPAYLETEVFRALLESAASEHGARMSAMRNASKNAQELIDHLTLVMNRARQADITREILEVVAGADAL
ncbi:MAG: ATP synthase F1 subunit gamma [Gaiellaceae bacterium]|jgi:F-type H+-transporting ATPase subunit gamma